MALMRPISTLVSTSSRPARLNCWKIMPQEERQSRSAWPRSSRHVHAVEADPAFGRIDQPVDAAEQASTCPHPNGRSRRRMSRAAISAETPDERRLAAEPLSEIFDPEHAGLPSVRSLALTEPQQHVTGRLQADDSPQRDGRNGEFAVGAVARGAAAWPQGTSQDSNMSAQVLQLNFIEPSAHAVAVETRGPLDGLLQRVGDGSPSRRPRPRRAGLARCRPQPACRRPWPPASPGRTCRCGSETPSHRPRPGCGHSPRRAGSRGNARRAPVFCSRSRSGPSPTSTLLPGTLSAMKSSMPFSTASRPA